MDTEFAKVIEQVETCRREIRCSNSGAFFRGHAASHFKLTPSLLRFPIKKDTEHNLYHECYARANHLLVGRTSSWEALSLLQHYGIPTRLLDWTESFAISLFFALSEKDANPHIWIVNAFQLNRESGVSNVPRIIMAGLDKIPDYYDSFIDLNNQNEWPFKKPVFIQIPWTSDRVRAQGGFFTIHSDSKPLDEVSSKYLRKVDIPPEAIAGARRFLEISGISEHTVFPDFVGLAGFLRRRYQL